MQRHVSLLMITVSLTLLTLSMSARAMSKKKSESSGQVVYEKQLSALILFTTPAFRDAFVAQKPSCEFSQAQMLGHKTATVEIPSTANFKTVKTCIEKIPGVVVVEKNTHVKALTTP